MSPTWRQLCWMSAILFLCSCGVTGVDLTSAPQTNSSAFVGLNGYRRYFANDSLIGRPVPCTRDDKICFRHNLIFDPDQDRCDAFDNSIYSTFRVNRTELYSGSSRLVGFFPTYLDPCTGYRMAYDGLCYNKEIVHDVICGREANLTRHPFGDSECRSALATPITVQQPEEDSSCVIPDIRFPDTERRLLFNNSLSETGRIEYDDALLPSFVDYSFQCEPTQVVCFSQEKVFVSGHEGCHALLEQGPCAEDHVVALDVQAANESRAEGVCVHVRGGCPKGYRRMFFDGECHEDREMEIIIPNNIILNQFGRYVVDSQTIHTDYGHEIYFALASNSDMCEIYIGAQTTIVSEIVTPALLPDCGTDDNGDCKLNEVINERPLPEF